VAAICLLALPALAAKKEKKPSARWTPGASGCTFAQDPDGKYRYGLRMPDVDVTLSVDAQELAVTHRRIEPFFSVLVAFRYHGTSSLGINPSKATLEFVTHHKVVQYALDPDLFASRTQDDADQLEFDTEREIKKHPERKEEREHYVQAYQKEVADFLEFLSSKSLPGVQLDAANPQANGWILFSTRNKWIGEWKKKEEFILRLTLSDRILEFPFALPPGDSSPLLRERTE
jgi:hypothetical protein